MIIPYRCILASALAATVVNGHGYMSKPAATFPASAGDKTQFIAQIDSSTSGLKGTFNTAPADNVASFTKAFKASSYKSLKEFIDDKAKISVKGATLTCGTADPNAAAQPVPSDLEWSHSDSEGFTASHEGPCEAWCDDTRVFEDENCAAHFTTAPAKMPYKSSSCSGASKLTFYWIAMHGPSWQVYVNCAPLSGSGGGGATNQTSSDASSTADTPTVTPATQETTPSTQATTAPSTTTGSSTGSAPSTTTAPSTGSAPSTSTGSSTESAPSTTTAPSSGSTASTPSVNLTPVTPSTGAGEESDCGSYDVAGSESDCGSYDVAGGESDCGSYDVAGGESDCGSYDVAGSNGDENQSTGTNTDTPNQDGNTGGSNQYYSGTKTNIGFNSLQNQNWNAGTVAPK